MRTALCSQLGLNLHQPLSSSSSCGSKEAHFHNSMVPLTATIMFMFIMSPLIMRPLFMFTCVRTPCPCSYSCSYSCVCTSCPHKSDDIVSPGLSHFCRTGWERVPRACSAQRGNTWLPGDAPAHQCIMSQLASYCTSYSVSLRSVSVGLIPHVLLRLTAFSLMASLHCATWKVCSNPVSIKWQARASVECLQHVASVPVSLMVSSNNSSVCVCMTRHRRSKTKVSANTNYTSCQSRQLWHETTSYHECS